MGIGENDSEADRLVEQFEVRPADDWQVVSLAGRLASLFTFAIDGKCCWVGRKAFRFAAIEIPVDADVKGRRSILQKLPVRSSALRRKRDIERSRCAMIIWIVCVTCVCKVLTWDIKCL